MFGKKKKEVESTGSTSRYQSSVRKVGGRITEERTVVVQRTISSYTSSVTTDIASLRLEGSPINHFQYPSIKENLTEDALQIPKRSSLLSKPRSSSSSEVGYISPFSRKLTPYQSDISRTRPTFLKTLEPPDLSRISTFPTTLKPSTGQLVSASTHSLPTSSKEVANHDDIVPKYNTTGKKRVIVINNIKFLNQDERQGAEIDEKDLNRLFKDMGMEVDTFRDLKGSAMKVKIKAFASSSTLKKVDMTIVVIMSHGSNKDDIGRPVMGSFTQIYGVDCKGLPIDEILGLFSAKHCPAMAGKPKIFIFQCCRGKELETIHVDAGPTQNVIRAHSDMLIAYSTLPGFYSIRDTIEGSWYIQSICTTFKKHAKDFDVETLLKIVDEQLSRKHDTYKQTSTYECRGFKRCYLNPR